MQLERFVKVNGKSLRLGYTTGSCAAAAAAASARMLFTGEEVSVSRLKIPAGVTLELPVERVSRRPEEVTCGVRKDGGDDPDVTHGLLILATVRQEKRDGPLTLSLRGGEGVGRVTLPGLEQPVGEAAINRVPRQMITEGVRREAERAGISGQVIVTIRVPGGEEAAMRTFNPRLGIVGGISILGTSGLVEPMSEAALTGSIRAELSVLAAAGERGVILTPGNYGQEFLRGEAVPDRLVVKVSNFLGEALDTAVELGFRRVLIAGHLGKLVKLAGGMWNTHSRYGDCRMELLAAHAARIGAGRETIEALLSAPTTVQGAEILEEAGLLPAVMDSLAEKVGENLQRRAGDGPETGAVAYLPERGFVMSSPGAEKLLEKYLKT